MSPLELSAELRCFRTGSCEVCIEDDHTVGSDHGNVHLQLQSGVGDCRTRGDDCARYVWNKQYLSTSTVGHVIGVYELNTGDDF